MDPHELHQSLYLSDGNIIIKCLSPSKKIVSFRVHQSLLAKHSPVFKTMLSLPQRDPEPLGLTYDGLPLVELPDPSEKIESLLRILYHEA